MAGKPMRGDKKLPFKKKAVKKAVRKGGKMVRAKKKDRPKHVQAEYDKYEYEFGLQCEGLFFVSFPMSSRCGNEPLYSGRLVDILDYVIDHKNFFRFDSVECGYIYKATVNYIEPGQSEELSQDKLRSREAVLLRQLKELQEEME